MSLSLKIKKGIDLNLEGKIEDFSHVAEVFPNLVALVPDDFAGLQLKPELKEGDSVNAGSPVLRDKADSEIKIVSPVNGTVKAIVRGERRKILRVEIVPGDSSTKFRVPECKDFRQAMANSGLWAMLRQLPYGIVPARESEPRDIFVTSLDTAPLAVDGTVLSPDRLANAQAGVEALASLTKGKVYVGRRPGQMPDFHGAEMIDVEGPHPAGNVGTLVGNIAPVNKGEVVWTLDFTLLERIGMLARDGFVDFGCTVAVTGSEIEKPALVRSVVGASMKSLLEGRLKKETHIRVISGNVLTGSAVGEDGFLRYPYHQVTVIPEGDDKVEFMGWASLSPEKMSFSRSFLGGFFKRRYNPDARVNGGRRAMIMSGEYESVMPLDIYPEFLLKAIISKDIDKMEQLGIYEVVPEDFALAEMIDTSKLPLQKIVREGLDYMRKETE